MAYKVIRFRTAGALYTLVSAGLGLVAVNSGNNLMYLITAMLLGYMLSSGVAGRRNLYGAELRAAFPDEIYAEEQCAVSVSVTDKRRVPIFLISVEKGADEAFFPCVPPGQTLDSTVFTRFSKRGRHKAGVFYLSSIYPFGLFKRYKHVVSEDEIVVFPSPVKYPDSIFMSEDTGAERRENIPDGTAETDIVGIRPYADGDSMRRVHWKSSAKSGKLTTKLYEGESAGSGRVIELDRIVSGGVERGLSMASCAIADSIRSGAPIGMMIRGSAVPPSAARDHKLRLLEMLADYHE